MGRYGLKAIDMQKELQEKIFNDFPKLFKHRDNLQASLMAFGFECNDGWFDLIYNLCKNINNYFETEYDGYEWDEHDVKTKCFHKVPSHFYVVQVKEKFGGLRFYVGSAPEKIHDMIHKAENKSYSICEHCGKPGKYRDSLPWILTLCDSCLDKHVMKVWNRIRKSKEDFISDWQKEHKAPFIEG